MHVQIVGLEVVNDRPVWSEETFEAPDIVAAMSVRGYQPNGAAGGRLREELRGKPCFQGLCGPVWGGHTPSGEPIIRYETWPAYEVLST